MEFGKFQQITVVFEEKHRCLRIIMQPTPTLTLTPGLLAELYTVQQKLADVFLGSTHELPQCLILSSHDPAIFSLGVDLSHILSLLKQRNKTALRNYFEQLVNVIYLNAINLNLPIMTCTEVHGKCYGAGLELAFSSDFVFANPSALFAYPALHNQRLSLFELYCLLPTKYPTVIDSPLLQGRKLSYAAMQKLGVNLLSQPQINTIIASMLDDFTHIIATCKCRKEHYLPTLKTNIALRIDCLVEQLFHISYLQMNQIQRVVKRQQQLSNQR